MKILLENVSREHFEWLQKMAKTLKFSFREIDLSEEEEDAALARAIDTERDDELLTPEETRHFINSLG